MAFFKFRLRTNSRAIKKTLTAQCFMSWPLLKGIISTLSLWTVYYIIWARFASNGTNSTVSCRAVICAHRLLASCVPLPFCSLRKSYKLISLPEIRFWDSRKLKMNFPSRNSFLGPSRNSFFGLRKAENARWAAVRNCMQIRSRLRT